MASLKQIHDGIAILMKYPDTDIEDCCGVSAEHDEVFFEGAGPDKITPEDVIRLEELGFTWDESFECWHRFT